MITSGRRGLVRQYEIDDEVEYKGDLQLKHMKDYDDMKRRSSAFTGDSARAIQQIQKTSTFGNSNFNESNTNIKTSEVVVSSTKLSSG